VDAGYDEWLKQVPESLRNDPVWKFAAYPKALFLFELAWYDCGRLMRDVRGKVVAAQLIRSTGSVNANIDEGFGRGGEAGDYVQFLRYALGSARETRGWYYKAHQLLPVEVIQHRMGLCDEVIALLVTAINRRKSAEQQRPPF
jgi:four helix bundle protein